MDNFVLRGNAWVYGDQLDADWHICSIDTLERLKSKGVPLTAEELGKHCLETMDPGFARRVKRGDFIVAGENVGYGAACLDGDDADPHFIGVATLAIKGAGIAAVVCQSSSISFLMNSLNHGLPVVECRELRGEVSQGDQLEIDLFAGTILNLTTRRVFSFSPFPEPLLDRLGKGGLYVQGHTMEVESR